MLCNLLRNCIGHNKGIGKVLGENLRIRTPRNLLASLKDNVRRLQHFLKGREIGERGIMDKVYLVLENGEAFEGKSIGVKGEAIGEVVFNTQMLGYLETLTDCSNYGQIVAQTFPLVGNYGIVESGAKSDKVFLNGYIVREICDEPSNFMSQGKLNDFLVANNVVGICDIDTRHLTKTIREQGVMNGIITSQSVLSDKQKKALKEYKIKLALENTCQKGVTGAFSKTASKKVVIWNFGDMADIKLQL
ncbi:MAG: carbamoyl-phosphate synthase domain-containing protein, partial [Clostridia bacterium]